MIIVRSTDIMKNSFLKIIVFCLVVIVILASFAHPAPDINDLEKHRLKGKVRSVMETKYSIEGKEINAAEDKIVYQKYTLFDMEGYQNQSTIFLEGEPFLVSKYNSGPDGKPFEMREYLPDGTLNLLVTYNYDDKGNIIEAVYKWKENHEVGEICENTDYYYEIVQNDIFKKVLYTNEYRGYCTEEKYVKEDNSLSFKFVTKYDFRGNRIEMGYHHGNGRLSWRTKYKYDRYANLIESSVFKSNRIAVFTIYKHQYDEEGNWVLRTEERDVHINILTAGLDTNNMITERTIAYY